MEDSTMAAVAMAIEVVVETTDIVDVVDVAIEEEVLVQDVKWLTVTHMAGAVTPV